MELMSLKPIIETWKVLGMIWLDLPRLSSFMFSIYRKVFLAKKGKKDMFYRRVLFFFFSVMVRQY